MNGDENRLLMSSTEAMPCRKTHVGTHPSGAQTVLFFSHVVNKGKSQKN